jgi:penicillin-binding protein 1A
VALLKSPTYLADNTEAAEERTSLVFQAMVENGKLTSQQLEALARPVLRTKLSDSLGRYYADWVASSIRLPETGDYSPLPVHTAFDAELQRVATDSVKKVLAKNPESHRASQAAMVVMRTDGRVVAMVGGRNYAESQFNRAVQARRQPGSSFKLFVYLAALRAGLSPDTRVSDAPFSVGDYRPENSSRRYRGVVSVHHAFASSINTVAVRLSEAVGRDPVIAAARDLGITTPIGRTPSLALGTYEVSLLELTSAYCAIAAGAYPIKPWAITEFGTSKDLGNPPKGSGSWRLEEKEAMRMLLRGTVQQGSGRKARLPIAAYGKTGTSQEYRDAWFVGFAGNLVVGVWVGNDDFSPMKRVTGGSLPAEIWQSFMREAIRSDKEFKPALEETDVFPAHPRASDELIQIATDTLGGAAAVSQRSNRASNQAKPPDYSSRNQWKKKWTQRRERGQRRQGLASRGFLQHLFQ